MTKAPKPDAWMPMFVADYAADTARLSLEQHGAYLLLIFDYWRNGPPPDDDVVLARILGVERREWFRLRPVIVRFFQIEAGLWRHKRIDAELAAAQTRSAKAHDRATKGAAARWGKQSSGECPEDAASNAPGNASSMLGASPKHMLEQCPPSSPLEESTSSEDKSSSDVVGPKPDAPPKGKGDPWDADPLFAKAWAAYPQLGKERSSRAKAWPKWREAAKRAGGSERLALAVVRYVREDKQHKGECGAPAFHRWLADSRWEHWLPGEGAAVLDLKRWAGPPEIREALALAMSPAQLASYLDPATWDAEARAIRAATNTAHGQLERALRDRAVVLDLASVEPFSLARPRAKDEAA